MLYHHLLLHLLVSDILPNSTSMAAYRGPSRSNPGPPSQIFWHLNMHHHAQKSIAMHILSTSFVDRTALNQMIILWLISCVNMKSEIASKFSAQASFFHESEDRRPSDALPTADGVIRVPLA